MELYDNSILQDQKTERSGMLHCKIHSLTPLSTFCKIFETSFSKIFRIQIFETT